MHDELCGMQLIVRYEMFNNNILCDHCMKILHKLRVHIQERNQMRGAGGGGGGELS